MNKNAFTKNEVRSGFLVTSCGLLLLVLLFMSGKSNLFQDTYQIQVLFSYISGLATNAPVHLAGHEVGKVTDIQFSGGDEPMVAATLTLRRDAVVRKDSDAFINIMGFMGETYIELTQGTRESRALENNDIIQGVDPVPMMEIVKRGTALLEEFEQTSTLLQSMLADLSGLVGNNQEELDSIIKNINSSTQNLDEMTHDLKLHPWKLLRKGKEKEELDEETKERLLLE